MKDLAGKKLLILGANPETIPLVQVANELGVKTIVTSNRPMPRSSMRGRLTTWTVWTYPA